MHQEYIIMSCFKNMKTDFHMLYKLNNYSGQELDEENHMIVALDEIWEEVIIDSTQNNIYSLFIQSFCYIGKPNSFIYLKLQVCQKMHQFKINPFQQYNIFEKICGDNVVNGIHAQSS